MANEPPRKGLLAWLIGQDSSTEPTSVPEAEGAASVSDTARIAAESKGAAITDRFEDEGEVGKGGMASVRRVKDGTLLRRVAMKVLDPRISANEVEAQRFVEEAQITGQLEHPNIVPIHELGIDEEGTYYFTMKLIQGDTLDAILKGKNYAATREAELFRVLQVFLKVCQALGFAHSRGVIHCDLKPANIMVGTHGQVYVMDWGIARLAAAARPSGAEKARDVVLLDRDQTRDAKGSIAGTAQYMSPEQAEGRGDDIDERTDVFCLGGILYKMLTGRSPYSGPTLAVILDKARTRQIAEPLSLMPALPPRLCDIAMKALSADPRERHQRVEELQAEVEGFLRGEGRYPVKHFPAGSIVVREGDVGNSAYVIETGQCRAFKGSGSSKQLLRVMEKGDVFGEASIFTSQPRSASVEAITAVTCTVVTREMLEQEMGQTVWITPFIRTLAQRFIEVDKRASRAQQKIDDAEALRIALVQIAFKGEAVSQTQRVVKWSILCPVLCKTLGRSEEEAAAIAARLPGGTLDVDNDLFVYRYVEPAPSGTTIPPPRG